MDQKKEEIELPEDLDERPADKVVDFKRLLNEYKQRAENKLAYTIQQVDDVIFIDNKHIVALEYIFYANHNGNYHRLVKHKVDVDDHSKDELGL